MKKHMRFLTVVFTVILVVSALCFTASAAKTQFTDVDANDKELTQAVSLLSYLNVTNGTTPTTFGTDENVTRQQMAAFIYRLVKNGKSFESSSINATDFTDLTDSTYFGYISWASANGIINGTSKTTFDPTGNITLQDAYAMLVRALDYEKNGAIAYPYGYIDIAEDEDVALDKNLSAEIDYSTALTRGNVATLLYNAFFAQTGVVQTKQTTRPIYSESTGSHRVIVETVEYSPTVAELYYGANRGKFTVRATPRYSFNDAPGSSIYTPLDYGFTEDNIRLVAVDGNEKVTDFIYEFDAFDLPGIADDYIMNVFDVFYTVKEDDQNSIDTILYADCQRSVEVATDATLVRRAPTKDSDYYTDEAGKKTSYAKLLGFMTYNKSRVYFFNAPYSYAKPVYSGDSTEAEKYDLRNAKNAKVIDLEFIGYDNNDQPLYNYYLLSNQPDTAEKMAEFFNQIYTDGIYTIVAYDADGDGLVDYMQYKPCTFGRIDQDESVVFTDVAEHYEGKPTYIDNEDTHPVAISKVPTIYTNGADVTGVEAKDGDYVLAYLNPNANMVEVFAVLGYTEGPISYINPSNGTIKVSGNTFRTHCTHLSVLGYNVGSTKEDNDTDYLRAATSGDFSYFKDSLLAVSSIGETFRVYTFKGTYNSVYFYEPKSSTTYNYSGENILIPLGEKDADITQDGYGYLISKFNSKTSKEEYYLKVWENGTIKYVSVDVHQMYPQPNVYDGNVNIGVFDEVDGLRYPAYIGKICTYTVDSDGVYTITPILHSYDETGAYTGVGKDASVLVEENSSKQFGYDLGHTESGIEGQAQIRKLISNRFELVDVWGNSLLGNDTQYISSFVMTDATRIIIRNYNTLTEEYEFVTYDKSNFKGTTSPDSLLTNVQYVLNGDPDSKVSAELVLLYAEAEDFEFEGKKITGDWRIIKSFTPGKDDQGNYCYYYDLINPFDGSVQEGVVGSKTSKRNIHDFPFEGVGQIVKVDVLGRVRENLSDDFGIVDPFLNEDYTSSLGEDFRMVWITGVDVENGILEIVNVEDTLAALDEIEDQDKKDAFDALIDEASLEPVFVDVGKNTVVSLIKGEGNDADIFVNKSTVSPLELSDLANAKNQIKAYNTKIEDGKGNLTTKYAKYVKACIKITASDDEDENDVADLIIVLANQNEEVAFLKK